MGNAADQLTPVISSGSDSCPFELSGSEIQKILVEWNRTERDYPLEKCLHELFQSQVSRTPDAIAVVYEQHSLTYQQLDTLANQLACHLATLGVGREDLVALGLERSLEMVVGIYGTIKAGAAYVPIDPGYPAERVAFMLADAQASVVLTQESLREKLPLTEARVICLDSLQELRVGECPAPPATGVAADNLAYVIYTSGSTGLPKGAMNTHRGIVNRLLWMQEMYQLGRKDCVLQKTPFSFDVSVWEFFWPLIAGARMVVARPGAHRDNRYLIQTIRSQQVTTLHFVPSMLRLFLQEKDVETCTSLRQVFCSGEALAWDLQQTFFKRLPGVALHNLYGPTEAAVDVTYWACQSDSDLNFVPIGRPIANTQIYILDEARRPLPAGVAGELYIGGAGVARGYYNRPELTAEKFVADPFSQDPAARLFRTADLARFLPDGNIEYLARMDQQVKIRGFRIELGEIESTLNTHPNVAACVVLAQAAERDETSLVAWLVMRSQQGMSVAGLRSWLGKKLPEYMIPSRFRIVSELPLTPNGKLDRLALAKMEGVPLTTGTDYVGPRNPAEATLAEIWQSVLRREKVGVLDNFFDLGGHSLLAVVICSQISNRWQVEIPVRWILEHPTIADLAGKVASQNGLPITTRPIRQANRDQPLPLSFGQQQMWLLQETLSDPATYNVPMACRLSGLVDREKVRRALRVIQNRHEILRTALVERDQDFGQQIVAAESALLLWDEIDLSELTPAQQPAAWEAGLRAEARRPFDLAKAPLWRAVWIKLTGQEQILGFTFHHSIVDEWSLRLFFDELAVIYGRGEQPPASLPELPIQYADYAVWQRGRLTGAHLKLQQDFWQEQLRDLPPALELPANQPRPAQRSNRGAVYEFTLTGSIVGSLRELARQERTTLFTVVLSAYYVWLYRLTGQADLLVGTPSTRRERPELQTLIGYFLNTLPIRARLEDNQGFREVLGQVREKLFDAFSNTDLPFEQMVQLTPREGDKGHSPLCQALFVLLEEGLAPLRLAEATGQWVPASTGTSKYDLILSIQTGALEWKCEFEYATDLFTADRVAQFAGTLAELLRSITSQPQAPIGRLTLLSATERQQILVERNRTERDLPQNKCVQKLFEEQVERTPDAVAAEFGKESLTYYELNTRANQLAHRLRSLGAGPDVLVGLSMERSLEMLTGVLGILKAGAAYVPLDPSLPWQRLAFMLANSECAAVITQNPLRSQFSECLPDGRPTLKILTLEELALSGPENGENPALLAGPQHLAYVLYTSGSTGQPKGVEMPHQPLVNLIRWQESTSAMGQGHRTLQFASLGFDVSFQEIFATWATGGTLVLLGDELRMNPPALLAALPNWRVNRLFLPFVMLDQLAEADRDQDGPDPYLMEVAVAGDQLRITPAIRRFFARRPGARLWNHYGPAEAHVVTSYELTGPAAAWPDLPPIGRALPNCQIYLLDAHGEPVPEGVTAELYLGGVCLCRGYRRRPDLTSERFLPHPFSRDPDERVYRTGDLARWNSGGEIEFLGRADYQVKIRGFRIELGEIEAVLGQLPEVAAGVVMARERKGGGKELVAYVVGRDSNRLQVAALRQELANKLPDYMVPARWVALPSLPLNANGKVDRKALEKLAAGEMEPGDDYLAPRNETEQILVEIWRSVLGRERVGVRDNFFALGGHSLLVVVMCARIARELAITVPVRRVFEHPTIAGLAGQLTALNGDTRLNEPIPPADRGQPLPMSFGQQGMWLAHQTMPDPAAYNEPVAWQITGVLDREKVRHALQKIHERHEALRTALLQKGANGGDLEQQIYGAEKIPLPWQEFDLSEMPADKQPAAKEACLMAEARRPFDLARAPLWRVAWIRVNGNEHILMLTFHHSIVDEWSLRLLFKELEQLYAADGQTDRAGLPQLPIQYADYAVWQRERLTGTRMQVPTDYWRAQLQELPASLVLPGDKAGPRQPTGAGAIHTFELAGLVPDGMRRLARQERTTLFTVALAAFQVWLYRLAGQPDVIVGIPSASRGQPELQKLIGYFLNTLPIRIKLAGNQSFCEVVHQVRQLLLDAFHHAELPFEQMVKLSLKERGNGISPLYQTLFVLLEEGLPPLRMGEAQCAQIPVHTRTCKNDLILSIHCGEEKWKCEFEYSTDRFTADRAADLGRYFTELLRSITEQPQAPISQLSLMSASERQLILREWSRTEADYPREKCVHELFEEQVERASGAVAAAFGEESLTYQELNTQANRLAHHMRSLGVGPEVLVGLCMDRSLEMLVGILGILKAGGAYVPLDPTLPPARLAFLISNAQCAAVVTQNSQLAELIRNLTLTQPTPTLVKLGAICPMGREDNPGPLVTPENPAYVLYTSGSTGQPKGVEMPHRPLVNLIHWQCANSAMGLGDRTLQFASLGFDVSFQEMFATWATGGTLVVVPEELRRDPPGLRLAIADWRIKRLFLPVVMLEQLAEADGDLPKPTTHLREIMVAGEQLRISPAIRRFLARQPGIRLWNHYGPTEAHVVTSYELAGPTETWPDLPSIGRPLPNCEIYLLDATGQPVPPGVVGELHIGGVCLARGYRQRPDLTEERFVPNPFGRDPGARLYHTGDLARWRTDGNIEFLGRADHQVKIRGHRIEPGEIEAMLAGQPEVQKVTVVVHEQTPGEKLLVAYLTARNRERPDPATLRARLVDKLPNYMVPSHFVWLDQMPLTSSGKVDRLALPAPASHNGETSQPPRQPANLLELELTRVWERIFKRQDIQRDDNFFELGGHSLQAASMAAEIDKLLHRKIPIAMLFQCPTIELLARRFSDENWAPAWSSLVPLQPLGSKPPFYFIHGFGGDVYVFTELAKLLGPDQPAYGIQAVLREDLSPRYATLPEMAAHYVLEINSLQPTGEIYLAGYSLGGTYAWEVAQQLHRAGRRVAMLAMLDSGPIGRVPWFYYVLAMASYLPDRLMIHCHNWWKLTARKKFSYLPGRWAALRYWIRQNQAPPTTKPALSIPIAEDHYLAAGRVYRLEPYPGKVDLFTSEQAWSGWSWYWRRMARGGATFHRVPGNHHTMLVQPHLPVLARALADVLQRRQAVVPHHGNNIS